MAENIALHVAQEALGRMVDSILDADATRVAGVVACSLGQPIALARMDGTPARVVTFALNKAYSAAYREASTLSLRDFLQREKIELAAFCNPQLTSIPGGAPIFSGGGCIGAVGISGRLPQEDHELAVLVVADIERMLAGETAGCR